MNIPPLLADWPLQPTVIAGIVITGLLYWRGVAYASHRGLAPHHRWWHSLAFVCGLLVTFIALDSPLDSLVDQFFWAHMVQHELLILVSAPLLLYGEPAMMVWRAVPLGGRRAALGWAFRATLPRRIGQVIARVFGQPRVIWALFLAVFLVWHLPSLYDLALRNESVHIVEHVMFLGAALLFWAQVVPSRPLHRNMSFLMQAVYVGTSAIVMNGLAAVYMYSTAPMYAYYAALPRPPGTMSALVDQHYAGSVMDVPGTILFFMAICALLVLWLREDERAPDRPEVRPSGGRWGTEARASATDVRVQSGR